MKHARPPPRIYNLAAFSTRFGALSQRRLNPTKIPRPEPDEIRRFDSIDNRRTSKS